MCILATLIKLEKNKKVMRKTENNKPVMQHSPVCSLKFPCT